VPTPRKIRRPKRAPGPERRGNLERQLTWSGLRAGDRVDVADLAQRGSVFSFHAFVVNVETQESWVEVIGGVGGDKKVRSFSPERIFPAGSLKGRSRSAPSLSDAPQFDL